MGLSSVGTLPFPLLCSLGRDVSENQNELSTVTLSCDGNGGDFDACISTYNG